MRTRHLLLPLALAACAPRAIVKQVGEGTVSFVWTGEADEVVVAGTMTSWRRVPLDRHGDRFEKTLPASSGRHEYRLEVRSGGDVRVVLPEGAERADDGYGGENGVLRVGGR